MFKSDLFGDDIKKILPVINTDGSDSAMFDNCLELLVLAGRSLPHAMMMMIPEPWENHESMSDEKRAFYEYHSCLMEPWDGPASIAFTDGSPHRRVLDRNGLRPSRYYVTKDDLVIMAQRSRRAATSRRSASQQKGRLQPGRMFLVDTEQGRIVADEEIKKQIATAAAVSRVARQNITSLLEDLPDAGAVRDQAGPRDGFAAAAGVRLHVRGLAMFIVGPMAQRRRAAARLDGHGHAAGGALEQAAIALQLFQAALRAGHEPAD